MENMRACSMLLGLAACMLLLGCGGSVDGAAQTPAAPTARKADLTVNRGLVDASNGLGFRLYQALAKTGGNQNIFISPTSIEMALGMTYNGAVGSTKEAMAATLGFKGMTLDAVNTGNAQLLTLLRNPDPKVELDIANSLWGRKGFIFDGGFIQRNKTSFQADVREIDFTAPTSADEINGWVSDKTHGKIPQLVTHDAINDALLVLINALYFKGAWSDPFDKANTQDGPFTLAGGTVKTMPMMQRTASMSYLETDKFQAVALPYGDKYVNMYVILPKDGTALSDVTASLTTGAWNGWVGQFAPQRVALSLPRFKADFSISLKPALTALGMGTAFSDQANFGAMLPPTMQPALLSKPMISDVIHKTVLEVNEEGTVAAAVTGVIMTTMAMPAQPVVMTVNHPFFLAIADKPTGAILFMGTIVEPK